LGRDVQISSGAWNLHCGEPIDHPTGGLPPARRGSKRGRAGGEGDFETEQMFPRRVGGVAAPVPSPGTRRGPGAVFPSTMEATMQTDNTPKPPTLIARDPLHGPP